jgi:predicted transcriptional regulator
MAPTSKDKQEIRVTIDKDTYRLLKKLAGVMESSMNGLMNDALDRFLESDDIQEVIDRHKLEVREDEE